MRDVPTAIAALLARRQGVSIRQLFWVKAKNRTTGEIETIGVWNGMDVEQFAIDGETRTYYGAGSFLGFGTLDQQTGLVIKQFKVSAAPMAPEIQNALRLYEPKFAPVEAHLAFYDPETNNLLADPFRMVKGWLDTLGINTPVAGDQAEATLNIVGNTRVLTRIVPSKRSDATQRLRSPTDTFFNDVAISGTLNTPWGASGTASTVSPVVNPYPAIKYPIGNILL